MDRVQLKTVKAWAGSDWPMPYKASSPSFSCVRLALGAGDGVSTSFSVVGKGVDVVVVGVDVVVVVVGSVCADEIPKSFNNS